MAYDFSNVSDEELARMAAQFDTTPRGKFVAPSKPLSEWTDEELETYAKMSDPQPAPEKDDGYGFTERRRDEITAQSGRDAFAGQEYIEGLAPFARSVREGGEREEDENQSAFLNGKALEDAIERHGDAPDESLKGYKAQQFGAVETGVRAAGHNLSRAAANLPLFIGEAVKGVRGLGRRAYNNKATDVLIDYARDAGFEDEEIERAKEHSQGDPYKMYDFFQELAEATVGHHADKKAKAAQRLAEHADEEGIASKIAGGALGMIPMMEEFAIGGGIVKGLGLAKGAVNAATWQGRLAAGLQHSKFMTPLMGSEFARRRYGELTHDEYVRDEDGNLVVQKGDDKGSALAKATAGGLGEAALFSLPIGEAVMGWAPKVVSKALRTKVSPTVAKMYENYVKYGQLTGLRGQPVMLGLMDANTFKDEVLGLAKKDGEYEGFGKEWDTFWNETMSAKNQADLFVSTLGVMAVQGGVALAKARSAIAKENRSTDAVLKTYFEVPDELLRQMSPEHKAMWRRLIMQRSKGKGFALNEENLRKFVNKMGDRYGEATKSLYEQMAKYALEKDNSRDWMKGVEATEETSFSVPKRRNAETGNVEVAWDEDTEDVGGRTIRTQSFTDQKTGITVTKFLPTDAGLSDDGYVYVVRDRNGRQATRRGITDAIDAARDMERAGNTAVRQRQNKADYIKELYAKNFPGESPEILDTAEQYQQRYGRALLPGQIALNADGKQVYILDRIETPQMAMKTVLHEVGRHRGLDFAIPDVNARAEFLRSLAASDDPVIQNQLARIAVSQGFASPEEALKDPYVVEEVYAHLFDHEGVPAEPAASGSSAAAPKKDAQAAAKAETQTPDAPKVEPKVALAAARRLGLLAYGSDAQLRKSLALAKEHGHDQIARDIETIIADRKAKANLPPREDEKSIGHAKTSAKDDGVEELDFSEIDGDAPKPKTVKVSKGQISMQDAYDLFNALNSNKETGELMDKVFNVMKDADIRLAIRHLEENSRDAKRERGETWSRVLGVEFGGNIELDLAYMNSSNAAQFKANTMLHEMIHAATDYAISLVDGKGRKPKDVVVSRELRDAVKDLHKIYDAVKDDFSKDYYLEYASQNVHEFIAELSNQSVRDALKKRNLWTRVVDAIRRVLRAFGGGAQESNAYEISEDVLDRFLSNFDREAFDAWRDSPDKSIDPSIPRGDLYANETRTAKMSVDGMDVRETARRLRERGASRFFDKNEELGAKVDWGDENREVKVVGGGVSPWQYKKGAKTKEAKAEIYELAQKNVAAQPNYVLDEASGNNALMLDGVKYRITKRGLFHGADRRLKNIGPAIAKIGDVLNASVEVPVDAKPWRYRIAATDFGKREYTLITSREVDGAQDVVDVQTLYSINVKSGDAARTVTSTNADRQSVGDGAARELNHTDANRLNTDIIANLKGAWQGLFEKNLAEHVAERRRRAAADNSAEKRLRTSADSEHFFDRAEERDDEKKPSPIDRAMTRGERFQERWQDSDVVVRNVQDEIGGVEDKIDAGGHTAAKTTFKEDGTVDALGSTDVYNAKDRENGYLEAGMRDIQSRTDKIDKVLATNGITPEQFDRYLYAAHAEERNRTVAERNGREYDPASGEGSGLSEIEAKKILSSPEVQRKRAAYESAAKMLYDMNDANLRRRLESGRISQELYDLLTKQWKRYVPLRTDVENGENAAFNLSTAGFRSSEFMTAEGRKEGNMADSPYAFARLQAEQGVRGSERNIVNMTFANLVRKSIADGKPIGEITEGRDEGRGIGWTFHFADGDRVQVGGSGKLAENRQDIVLFKEDGKLKAIRVNPGAEGRGLALAQAVTGENVKRWAKELSWLPKATRWLSAMRTQYSPEFIFTNSLADHLEAAQALVGRYGIASGTALAAKAAAWEAKNLKSLRAYINGGAPTGYVKEAIDGGLLIKGGVASQGFAGEVEAIKSNYDRFVRDAKKLYRMNPKELGGFVWDGMKDLVSHANELVENSTRIGIYSALRERGVPVNEAVKFARDATVNFNRRGTMMPWFNGLYMFANASVQGAVRSFQAMGDRHGAQLVSLLVAAGVAKAVLDHYFGNDDEREKAGGRNARNMSEYEKKHILGIPVGGGKQIAALRMRGPYAAIPYLAQTFTNVALGETEAEDAMHTVFREITDQASDLVSGNGVVNDKGGIDAALVGQTLAPSLADPLVQLWTGKDYKGDWRTAKSYDPNKPLSANGKRNTAEAYKMAAQSLNWLTGGNENRKGMIDVAPEDLQLVVEFLGGGIGRDIHNVAATTKNVAQLANGETPERTLSQTPLLRTLLREYPESTARYYDAIDEYNRDKYEIKKAKTAKEIMAVAKGKPYLSRGKTPLDERIERVKELMHLERGERKIRNRWVKVESVSEAQRETYRKMRLKLQAAILKALRK